MAWSPAPVRARPREGTGRRRWRGAVHHSGGPASGQLLPEEIDAIATRD